MQSLKHVFNQAALKELLEKQVIIYKERGKICFNKFFLAKVTDEILRILSANKFDPETIEILSVEKKNLVKIAVYNEVLSLYSEDLANERLDECLKILDLMISEVF